MFNTHIQFLLIKYTSVNMAKENNTCILSVSGSGIQAQISWVLKA